MQLFVGYIYKNIHLILIRLAISITLLFISGLSFAKDDEDYAAYAKEQAETAKIITAPYKKEIEELIRKTEARQQQPNIKSFQVEIGNVSKTQCQTLYKDVLITPKDVSVSSKLPQYPVAIFVSFSMPKESIKLWISQAEKIGASVYLRGLVNNSFKDTVIAVKDLLQGQKGGLLVDPTIFKKHEITQVPAVVFVSNGAANVLYGDVTLDYALEKINKEVSDSYDNSLLVDAIKKLRQGKQIISLAADKQVQRKHE